MDQAFSKNTGIGKNDSTGVMKELKDKLRKTGGMQKNGSYDHG